MSGITYQFANSPINKRIRRLTVSVTGTIAALVTGSSVLMWEGYTPTGNGGNIFISTLEDGSEFVTLEASRATGYRPGNLQNYFWWGDTAGDALEIWEHE